jgi:uncharacterized protein YndB with AHSA1/START domain
MKKGKKIALILLIIIVIPLVVALFVKKDFAVEREVTINKPCNEVFEYIKLLKNQDHYSVWVMKDPNMKKEYKGIDGTVGFISSWDSQNKEVGKGEQEIVKITEGERIDSKLRFKVPFEAENDAYMATEKISNEQTKVKWGFKGAFPYPMNLMSLFVSMDKRVGPDLNTGLINLKNVLEKQHN